MSNTRVFERNSEVVRADVVAARNNADFVGTRLNWVAVVTTTACVREPIVRLSLTYGLKQKQSAKEYLAHSLRHKANCCTNSQNKKAVVHRCSEGAVATTSSQRSSSCHGCHSNRSIR
jgi:hypothetical protein